MYLVGLTGGIGSGKSTVARRLAELGAPVIDADQVAREVVAPGEPALAELAERFGGHLVDARGDLDRAGLAAIVFVDDEARRDLDRIMHPRIAARIAERIAALAANWDRPGPPLAVVDHPLLIETGQAGRFDAVVVVLAPEEERVRRLVEQRGLDEGDARARVAVQCSDEERRRAATHVIVNDGDLRALVAAVDDVHAHLVADAHRRG
ncbi:dephospho-CoA kinase [Egicoccus sp. AB-alg2]|uniref:dephospho-CoA kinase n=1 Tax=Egicoccus sp. AB-alg2 TaxID=3242693 RepID=UPI00359D300F